MILTGVIIAAVAGVYLGLAGLQAVMLRLSFRQALLYLPFKLAYRIDDAPIRLARKADAPVVYVVTHRSKIEPALMLSLLPDDTLHILDAYSATVAWLEPWRAMARTIAFNAEHVFVSRRLVQVLKRKGRIAVYIPENVEPDMRAFRLYRAVSRIAIAAEARIVPIFIDGARQLPTALAPNGEKAKRLFPWLRIGVLRAATIPELVAEGGVQATGSNALFDRIAQTRSATKFSGLTIFQAAVAAAQRFSPDRAIVADTITGSLSYRRMLIAVRIFAGRFARITAPGETVGLLLPNANGVAISLLGLLSGGRVAGMLNYSAGPAAIASAVTTALIRTVISSRGFVEKAKLEDIVKAVENGGARIVWIEDLRDGITPFDKLAAAVLWRSAVATQNDKGPAVVMFTSGSEGAPKAIVLSHVNLVTNAMQVEARLAITREDSLLNVLPVFHAFGLTGGVILPMLTGVRSLLYPSPLHYKAIPLLAAKEMPTILFATDTFLAAYAKAAADGAFSSIRLVVAGAEPLREPTRQVWRERFGVPILEGYGMTEASPVLALNTATHGREGSVGRMLPGIRVRLEPVEGLAGGSRLFVSGPNIMLGSIAADRPGVVGPAAGAWHDTGDIVTIDREGFVTLRGRAKRFAKIAGEMVSLAAVETLAHGIWPDDRHAVVSVPDARRGERLVLVTTAANAETADLQRHAKDAGASALGVPGDIVKVQELPLTGTGKVDHRAIRQLAIERLGVAAAA